MQMEEWESSAAPQKNISFFCFDGELQKGREMVNFDIELSVENMSVTAKAC